MLGLMRISMVGLALWAGPALAQETVDATDPAKLEAILKGFGIARLEANSSSGNPQIDGRSDGIAYKLFFYGCTDNKNCRSVQFWAYWSRQVPLDRINAWNRDTRYGKVYVDADNDVVLEFDVNMVRGMSDRTFEDNANIWTTMMSKVEKELVGQ